MSPAQEWRDSKERRQGQRCRLTEPGPAALRQASRIISAEPSRTPTFGIQGRTGPRKVGSGFPMEDSTSSGTHILVEELGQSGGPGLGCRDPNLVRCLVFVGAESDVSQPPCAATRPHITPTARGRLCHTITRLVYITWQWLESLGQTGQNCRDAPVQNIVGFDCHEKCPIIDHAMSS